MEHASVPPDAADIGLAAAAMCRNNKQKAGWAAKAFDLLMSNPSPKIPVDAYDAVLACMADESNWKDAIRLLREMEKGSTCIEASGADLRKHPSPTLATYRAVIECTVSVNRVEQAVQIVLSMPARGITPTAHTFELVIAALAKQSQWRRALHLLDLMDTLSVQKSLWTYNTIIAACGRSKEVGMAKSLLGRMKKEGTRPTIVTYNS